MHYQPVNSSNLRAVAYDPSTQLLGIRFKGNTEYHYYGVPQSIYLGLMNASSHGSYHAAYIKDVYQYRRVA
ncbi:KTSC domain-containing protein [Brevibacillus sp. HB2.2]|uniref:KTSC domain-containing protein n=1 Tax=Brevibacillus sp. HB2.2 TaxID=2738846 RepID=UPI00156B1660|nr:KTSC domain-containing protein [Brevibacillus sp. HB2.2]NRS51954.1 KTSC domain-containing protein [Brevibacillus sp. HB2.2]